MINYSDSLSKENLYCSKATNQNNIILGLGDLPKQIKLGNQYSLCGYIEKDGTYHKCNSCEHKTIIRNIILNNYLEEYKKISSNILEKCPFGMLQEEYFAMKILGFVKISSFKENINEMYLFRYDYLTKAQSEIVYRT